MEEHIVDITKTPSEILLNFSTVEEFDTYIDNISDYRLFNESELSWIRYTRRTIKNRINMKSYRKRKRNEMDELELSYIDLMNDNIMLRKRVQELEYQLNWTKSIGLTLIELGLQYSE